MGGDGGGSGDPDGGHVGEVGHGQAVSALEGLEGHVGGDDGGSGDPDEGHGDGDGQIAMVKVLEV